MDEDFRDRIVRLANDPRGKFIVALAGEEIVGQALLDPLSLAVTSHVVVLTIAIHEGHQGRGLGKLLLTHLIEWAKSNPAIERIELRVRSANKSAIGLYEKMGFVEEGRMVKRIKIAPGRYLDDIVMALWVGD
jgi:putative acetyltransferase